MAFLGNLLLRFLGAVQFLTVVPVSRSTVPVHESAPFFPLVGAMIGVAAALPMAWLPLPAGIEAGLVLMIQLAMTGMLHEDGLADVADGVRKGRSREKMFEIIKDSRVGSYGASALCISLLLRWQGLDAVSRGASGPWQVLLQVGASEGLSRCVILWLGLITPAAREGMGAYLSENRSHLTTVSSLLSAAVLLSCFGWERGGVLLAGLLVLLVWARQYFVARLGGVVGDCFGALQQACVIYCLVVMSWPRS
jgi:adenosylcobinamide-GDP ribazoletransferase